MRSDKFTQKTSEVLEEAQRLTDSMGQQAVELSHLMLALMQQVGGVVPSLLDLIGVERSLLEKELNSKGRVIIRERCASTENWKEKFIQLVCLSSGKELLLKLRSRPAPSFAKEK